MKKHLFSRILSLVLVAALLVGFAVPVNAAKSGITWEKSDVTVSADLTDRQVEDNVAEDAYKPTDMVRVSIVLEEKSTVQAGYSTMGIAQNDEAMAYNEKLQARQETMAQTISAKALGGKKLDVVWNLTLVGNLISANVPYGKIDAIRAVDGVKDVVMETVYEPCVVSRGETNEPQMYTSSGMIGSNLVWAQGYTGAGSRVAVIDTGTDVDHQSFDNDAFVYSLQENARKAGVSYDAYVKSLDLLDKEEIAAVLPKLNAYRANPTLTADRLCQGEKLAYAYNYMDKNYDVTHLNDYQGEHGSHVAGISTANAFIYRNGDYVDAAETVYVRGVAPDAQLITMKVFGHAGGPRDSDYMAAIEDAILLGCDSVNLSLGSGEAGYAYNDYFTDLLEYMTQTDTVVVASASNDSAWPTQSFFGYLYADDVNLDTVGSPGSYGSSLTVASVENAGSISYRFNVGGTDFSYLDGAYSYAYDMATLDTTEDHSGTELDYIFIDGFGLEADYQGMDLAGKVVFCSRGTSGFAAKANVAAALGAAATVIYNNAPGSLGLNLSGYGYYAPCASITQYDASLIRAASTEQTTEDGLSYFTGKLTIYGNKGAVMSNSEYYTMSEFSSWGVPGNLTLKPEITAPGGNIYSVWGKTPAGGGADQYELMSGTSMAAPQITGMVALLAQYIRENGLDEATGLSARHLAQSLLMSTADPIREEASGGNYYSLMVQGAGLARVDKAVSAESYVLVDGQDDAKVKAELGDDPLRTGEYDFTFSIHNITDKDLTYTLDADVFVQDVFEDQGFRFLDYGTAPISAMVTFTSDGKNIMAAGETFDCDVNGDGVTDALDADYLLEYVLGNETELKADGDLNGDGKVNSFDAHLLLAMLGRNTCVTVPAEGSVDVSVHMALTDSAKAYLDEVNPNGAYVQAFVFANAVADEEGVAGVDHSIPVLAFYGSWTDASMFDKGSYVENELGGSETPPYLAYYVGAKNNFLSVSHGDGREFFFGGNPLYNDDEYLPQRNAINSNRDSLERMFFSLIRNAEDTAVVITDADTGEVYAQRQAGDMYGAWFYTNGGKWQNVQQATKVGWNGTDAQGNPLPEGTRVNVSMRAVPSYYRDGNGGYDYTTLGDGAYFTTPITIDNTAPEVEDIRLSVLNGNTLQVVAKDNQYVAGVLVYNASGNTLMAGNTPNQTEPGVEVVVEVDLSEVYGQEFLIVVSDYAYNTTTYTVQMDLGQQARPYFTVIGYTKGQTNGSVGYLGFDSDGSGNIISYDFLGGCPGKASPRSAEYVDGYVFEITVDNELYVGKDSDLTDFRFLTKLDPENRYLIQEFADMAYNTVDGKLYTVLLSAINTGDPEYPDAFLGSIDMFSGELTVLCEYPNYVDTLAIDDEGNFYSVCGRSFDWAPSNLYTYTLDEVMNGVMHDRGVVNIGYDLAIYNPPYVSSLAWDHNTDELFWMYPDTLVKLNVEDASESQLMNYYWYIPDDNIGGINRCGGLFIRPVEDEGQFKPVDQVDYVTVTPSVTRLPEGQELTLLGQVWPWNVTDGSVTWKSSDETKATVNENGVVSSLSAGTVTITATSNLDPTKSATCTLEVVKMDQKLNGIVWDEDGRVWWSEFAVNDLPNFTKLTKEPAEKTFNTAAFGPDGTLYAGSYDARTGLSELYTVNPDTFEATRVGGSTMISYGDLTYAPGLDALMATYGPQLLMIDPATGEYFNYIYMWYYSLVGVSYVQTTEYEGTPVDWFLLIDTHGYVYYLGFLVEDGEMWFLTDQSIGDVLGQMDMEMDNDEFSSVYFDGEYLYWTAYVEATNDVTLMVRDMATGNDFNMGRFNDGVWPVGGLYQEGGAYVPSSFDQDNLSQPQKVENLGQMLAMKTKAPAKTGSLNAVAQPLSTGTYEKDSDKVTVDITALADSTNGILTVEYDADALTLERVNGLTQAFAYADDNGTLKLAYAAADTLAKDSKLATLTFTRKETASDSTELRIFQGECNQEFLECCEIVTVELPHVCPSAEFVDVKTTDWFHPYVDYVVDEGLMIGMDKTHFAPNADMTRAQMVMVLYRMAGSPQVETVTPFVDVAENAWYAKAVAWAYQNDIAKGVSDTRFQPNAPVTRQQMVAFFARFAAFCGVDVTAGGDLKDFTDAALVDSYAVDAMIWAVESGLIEGMGDGTINPKGNATRAQIATILMRYFETFR